MSTNQQEVMKRSSILQSAVFSWQVEFTIISLELEILFKLKKWF